MLSSNHPPLPSSRLDLSPRARAAGPGSLGALALSVLVVIAVLATSSPTLAGRGHDSANVAAAMGSGAAGGGDGPTDESTGTLGSSAAIDKGGAERKLRDRDGPRSGRGTDEETGAPEDPWQSESPEPWTPDPTIDPWTPGTTFDPWTPGPTWDPWTPDPTWDPWTPGPTWDPWTPGPTIDPWTPGPTLNPWTPGPTVDPWTPRPTATATPRPTATPTPRPTPTATPRPTATPTPRPTPTATPTPRPTATATPRPTPTATPTPTDPPSGPVVILRVGDSIAAAMAAATPGTTIYLRGGTYDQSPNLRPAPGTAADRNVLASYPGERATIRGLPTFNDPDHWTFRNITFTEGSTVRLHMLKIHGGTGWTLDGIEVHGSTQTGLLVARSSTYGAPKSWTIRNSYLHDTGYTPAYINPGRDSTDGLIERNIFVRSGTEDLKLGWGGTDVAAHASEYGIGEVVVRYNTMVTGVQPFAICEPGGTLRVEAYRNLIVNGSRGFLVRIDNEEGQLGTDIWVHDNAGWGATKFAEDFGKSPTVMSRMSGNILVDPKLDSGFHPTNPAAMDYGRFAR